MLAIPTTSADITAGTSGESSTLTNLLPNKCSVGTQTDFSLLNSEIIMTNEPQLSPSLSLSAHNVEKHPVQSTPIQNKNISIQYRDEFLSPLKKRPNICLFDPVPPEVDVEFQESLTPISPIGHVLETTEESILGLEGKDDVRDQDYIQEQETFEDSELLNVADVLYAEELPSAPTILPLTEEQLVSDNKLIVFESMLDSLIYKLPCQHPSVCKFPIKSIFKSYEGSGCRITGQCHKGHTFFYYRDSTKDKKNVFG